MVADAEAAEAGTPEGEEREGGKEPEQQPELPPGLAVLDVGPYQVGVAGARVLALWCAVPPGLAVYPLVGGSERVVGVRCAPGVGCAGCGALPGGF